MPDTQEIQWHLEPLCSMILISGAPDSLEQHSLLLEVDGVSPSVFRCTSIPMETGPKVTCGET